MGSHPWPHQCKEHHPHSGNDQERQHNPAGNLLEAAIVVESRTGPLGGDQLDALIERAGIEVVPISAEQATIARRAWRRFGKGRHAAGLNLGDCLAYALAESTREPLLFKGDDFARTGIEPA